MRGAELAGGRYGGVKTEPCGDGRERINWGTPAWEPNFDGILGPVEFDIPYILSHTPDRELLVTELGERAANGLIFGAFDVRSEANFYKANGFFSDGQV